MEFARIAPPNSIIFVMDPRSQDIEFPKTLAERGITATPSVIVVPCLAFMDGETEVRLGSDAEVGDQSPPAYSGKLHVPSGVVSVRTSENEEVLALQVPRGRARVRVWMNDLREPTLVRIGVTRGFLGNV